LLAFAPNDLAFYEPMLRVEVGRIGRTDIIFAHLNVIEGILPIERRFGFEQLVLILIKHLQFDSPQLSLI
jgi:hypothetical protein